MGNRGRQDLIGVRALNKTTPWRCSFAHHGVFIYIVDMALSVQEAIDTTYLDTAHYNVTCEFTGGFEELNRIVIKEASNLVPFYVVDGALKTPEITIKAIVTARQEYLLRRLYLSTVHNKYIDQRYPIHVSWGYPKLDNYGDCYLSKYTPPDSVNYTNAEILEVEFNLRVI